MRGAWHWAVATVTVPLARREAGQRELADALVGGWEPYAVTQDDNVTRHYLRKAVAA